MSAPQTFQSYVHTLQGPLIASLFSMMWVPQLLPVMKAKRERSGSMELAVCRLSSTFKLIQMTTQCLSSWYAWIIWTSVINNLSCQVAIIWYPMDLIYLDPSISLTLSFRIIDSTHSGFMMSWINTSFINKFGTLSDHTSWCVRLILRVYQSSVQRPGIFWWALKRPFLHRKTIWQ